MKRWLYPIFFVFVFVGLVVSCSDDDDSFWDSLIPETEEEDPTQSQINGYVFKPELQPATDEHVQQLELPAGFNIQKFAEGLVNPRILVANNTGHVYVSDRQEGLVLLLEDTNGDGAAERIETVAEIDQAHGLTIHQNRLYIVTIREIYAADINSDGTLGEPQLLSDELPDGGQHPNRTIAFGPDGMMYVTVGSTCNTCHEPNEKHATVLRANPDGSDLHIYAEGLRNTIGFGWHPETGEMWGMDHGIDWLGDTEQMEELNRIEEGADYGWPYIYDNGKYNPVDRPQGDTTYQEYLAMTTLPLMLYTAHAAPMEMEFYTADQFPADYQGDAFIAMRGSWNRSNPVGYKLVRLHFENGQPSHFEDFVSDFLVNGNRAHFGRLVGLATHADGSLLLSDDTNGVIYRIAYQQ
ncbi:sorbosone dehydrogenase family protein [Cesiribacter sp. SM1]|uniref:PQQ-dependent sugar dehydrogenase n=1 Tax=Cesiribacter sp. SM1 TaxID=2861196 RepID=UPI001CD2B840|nr:PQQ-dependent sugar dehydrogenase [Cesiribacter sp. SM1]